MFKKFSLGLAAMAVGFIALTGTASAQQLGVSYSLDTVSQYVFRGVGLADGAVQPGVEVSFGGAYAGAWYSHPFDEQYTEETDIYLGYSFRLHGKLSGDVGVTRYYYPGPGDTTEFYAGLNYSAASLYAYYDTDLETVTVEGSLDTSHPVGPKTSVGLGASIGAVMPDSGFDYEYAVVGVSVHQALAPGLSGYVGLNAGASSEDTFIDDDDGFDSNGIWASVGLSYSQ